MHTTQSSGAFCAGNPENPPAKVPPVTLETLVDDPDESQPPVMAEPVPTQPPVEIPDTPLPETQFQDAQSQVDDLMGSPLKGSGLGGGSPPDHLPSAPVPADGEAPGEEDESEPGDSASAVPVAGRKKRDPNDFKLLGVPTMFKEMGRKWYCFVASLYEIPPN